MLGPGATGKSTLVEALLATLGDYAYKASFETFLSQRRNGGPRPSQRSEQQGGEERERVFHLGSFHLLAVAFGGLGSCR